MTLEELLAWLGDLLEDVAHWVFEKICDWWPDFYWFYQNPAYMIETWLGDWIPAVGDFLDDPWLWVRRQIAFALGFPLDFVNDPWYYLFRFVLVGFANAGEREIVRHTDIIRQVMVYFFRGESSLLKRIPYQ